MILSGDEIRKQQGTDIQIDPFCESHLNPNSYNLTLHDEVMIYEEVVLDMRKPNRVRRISIPPEGIVLSPNQLYLGRTAEKTETHKLVPSIQGRSSVARLGLFVTASAGFGDVGFAGYWTLQMYAVQPVRVYSGVPICEIYFHQLAGTAHEYKSDKYQLNSDIQPSMMHRELDPSAEQVESQLQLPFAMHRPRRVDHVTAK